MGQAPEAVILGALGALGRVGTVTARSRLYVSPAWPDPRDPDFLNAVAAFETALPPAGLLAALHAIEAGFGRRRSAPNAPRTLDLDLIDYNGLILRGEGDPPITLPHPRMQDRDFVLAPLAEVAPGWVHPVSGKGVQTLLAAIAKPPARPLAAGEAILQRNG